VGRYFHRRHYCHLSLTLVELVPHLGLRDAVYRLRLVKLAIADQPVAKRLVDAKLEKRIKQGDHFPAIGSRRGRLPRGGRHDALVKVPVTVRRGQQLGRGLRRADLQRPRSLGRHLANFDRGPPPLRRLGLHMGRGPIQRRQVHPRYGGDGGCGYLLFAVSNLIYHYHVEQSSEHFRWQRRWRL
jgi:hypothetical protein